MLLSSDSKEEENVMLGVTNPRNTWLIKMQF